MSDIAPILGSDIAIGTPSDGDTVFSIDNGQTRRFLLEAIAAYIAPLVTADVIDDVVTADSLATLLDETTAPIIADVDDLSATVSGLAADALGFGLIVNGDPLTASATTIPSTNIRYYSRLLAGGSIDKIGLEVTIQSGNIRLAVHRNSGNGRDAEPGELIADTGSVACPAVGWAEIDVLSAPVTVEPGDWISIASDNSTAQFRSMANVNLGSNDLYAGRAAAKSSDYTPASNPAPTSGLQRVVLMVGIPPS